MKLQDRLPDGVTVDGKKYRLNLDFRNVLRMMDVMGSDDLMPQARDYLALKCLTRRPKNVEKVLPEVRKLLFGDAPPAGGEKVTSFEQDAGLIRAAFRQVYRIDLFRDKLHWLEFRELLQNLPDGNRYEEIIGIRSRPIPAATKYNQKGREWLIKAKQSCALHLTEAEAAKKYESDISRIFSGIMAMMPKEEVSKKDAE